MPFLTKLWRFNPKISIALPALLLLSLVTLGVTSAFVFKQASGHGEAVAQVSETVLPIQQLVAATASTVELLNARLLGVQANMFRPAGAVAQTERAFDTLAKMRSDMAEHTGSAAMAQSIRALVVSLDVALAKRSLILEGLKAGDLSRCEKNYEQWFESLVGLRKQLETARREADALSTQQLTHLGGQAQSILQLMLLSSVLVSLMLVGAVMYILRAVTAPLNRSLANIETLKRGQFDQVITARGGQSEISKINAALEDLRNRLASGRAAEEEMALARDASLKRGQRIEQVVSTFENSVAGVVAAVQGASDSLAEEATNLNTKAGNATIQSTAVAAAAEEAANNVASLEAGARVLNDMAGQIAHRLALAGDVTSEAVRCIASTDDVVAGLERSAHDIANAVKLINDIADKTNLLALNATIEAARAGVAGRGFAVVASEIKELAGQTMTATAQIGQMVGAIQTNTGRTVGTFAEIRSAIDRIEAITGDIAGAVTAQNDSSGTIVLNANQAAAGVADVSRNISDVSDITQQTAGSSGQLLDFAADLSRQANTMRAEVDAFLGAVRSA